MFVENSIQSRPIIANLGIYKNNETPAVVLLNLYAIHSDHFLGLVCHESRLVVWGAGCNHILGLVCHESTQVVWGLAAITF